MTQKYNVEVFRNGVRTHVRGPFADKAAAEAYITRSKFRMDNWAAEFKAVPVEGEGDDPSPASLFERARLNLLAAGWVQNPTIYSTSSCASCAAEAYVRSR